MVVSAQGRKPVNQNDIIGPWSEDKLQLLRKYLHAYTVIMQGQSWCRNGYHYIDAFAGTGKPRARDEERYIDGSPRIALTIQHPFHSYTYIEKTLWRVQRLRELEGEFPDRDIRIREGDCNRIITTEITPHIRYERFNRGLIFLDPFGMDTEWSTIEQIAETRALEIFMNFPVMALNRTVLPNDPNALTEAQIEQMNRFWGTTEWRGEIYEEVPTLFGPVEMKIRRTTGQRLGQLFKKRLEEVFSHVTDPLVMTNSRNAPLYCLIFAGHKPTGAKIVRDIFQRYQRLGR
jgi:three-Cys-motif partner protein